MVDPADFIDLDGHRVDPHLLDQFFDGETGERITDEQWDESQRRLRGESI